MGLFNFVKEAGEKLWDNLTDHKGQGDNITATDAKDEATYDTVKSGDTLSAISKTGYGDANQYNKIFEANRPMLSSPDKIYPGQTLRIPKA